MVPAHSRNTRYNQLSILNSFARGVGKCRCPFQDVALPMAHKLLDRRETPQCCSNSSTIIIRTLEIKIASLFLLCCMFSVFTKS